MTVLNIQMIHIEDMVTVEFKISIGGGQPVYVSKKLECLNDYYAFLNDVQNRLAPVEEQVIHALSKQTKAKHNGEKQHIAVAGR